MLESVTTIKDTRKLRSAIKPSKTDHEFTLNATLAERFETLHSEVAGKMTPLAQLADEVRSRHLSFKGYDKAFREWWKEHKLDKRAFGSIANFTKYAKAGELLRKGEQAGFVNNLPIHCLTAMYEASQLPDEDIQKCITAGKLHPNATASQIRRWREKRDSKPEEYCLTAAVLAKIEAKLLAATGTFKSEFQDGIRALIKDMRKKLAADEAGED
jgi:hypothetical protein